MQEENGPHRLGTEHGGSEVRPFGKHIHLRKIRLKGVSKISQIPTSDQLICKSVNLIEMFCLIAISLIAMYCETLIMQMCLVVIKQEGLTQPAA